MNNTVYIVHWLTDGTYEEHTDRTEFALRLLEIREFGFDENTDYTIPEPLYIQYIANCYHCSDCWGEKMTVDDMRISLIEWNKEKNPEDYCPHPSLAKQCADYWNHLCDLYPN